MELLSPDHGSTTTNNFSARSWSRPVVADLVSTADRTEDRQIGQQSLRDRPDDNYAANNNHDPSHDDYDAEQHADTGNDHDERRHIRNQDRFEREVERHRQRSGRRRLGHERGPAAPLYLRRRGPSAGHDVDAQRHGTSQLDALLRRLKSRRQPPAHSRTGQRRRLLRGYSRHAESEDRVATRTRPVRTVGGAFTGIGVASYVIFIPVIARLWLSWHRFGAFTNHQVVDASWAAIGLIWITLVIQIFRSIRRQLNGRGPQASRSGIVWVASVIVMLISYVTPAGAVVARASTAASSSYEVRAGDSLWSIAQSQLGDGAKWRELVAANAGSQIGEELDRDPETVHVGWTIQLPTTAPATSTTVVSPMATPDVSQTNSSPAHSFAAPSDGSGENSSGSSRAPWPGGSLGALPLALIAKRRRDFIRQSRSEIDDADVEATIVQLRGYDDAQLRALARAIGDRPAGLVAVNRLVAYDEAAAYDGSPVVAVVLAADDDATLVAFARPGHALAIGPEGAQLVDRYAVVVNGNGQCRVTTTPDSALRALALRSSFDDVVIFTGVANELEDQVAARCVTISDGPFRLNNTVTYEGRTWQYSRPVPAPLVQVRPRVSTAFATATPRSSVRVELLRAEVAVTGLSEPFLSTLRRRCVEMTAYLAVHHREPVTGDRLRTRVLGDGSDASLRTLANTATAIRRSLGTTEHGPRLHPVTPAGLYQLHDVDCDLVEFHQLIAAARDPQTRDTSQSLRRALALIHSEPLATALRGFEWFLAEGHLARLQRDGEWAALQLASDAKDSGDFDLAFWAIEQGRLLDPYSEALEAALHRVPRLREFGRDRPGGTKDEAVGAG